MLLKHNKEKRWKKNIKKLGAKLWKAARRT